MAVVVVTLALCLLGCSTVHEELSWKGQVQEEIIHGQQVGEEKYTLTGNPFFSTDKGYMEIEGKCRFKEVKQKVKTYTYAPLFKDRGLISFATGLVMFPIELSEVVVSSLPLTPDIYGKDEELAAGIKEKYQDKREIVGIEETGEIISENISLAGMEVSITLPHLGYERVTHLGSFGRFYIDPQLLYRYKSAEIMIIRLPGLSEKEVWTKKISSLLKEAGNFRPGEDGNIALKKKEYEHIEVSANPVFASLHAGGHGEVEIQVTDKRSSSMMEGLDRFKVKGEILLKNVSSAYHVGNVDVGFLCPGDKVTIKSPVRIPALVPSGTYSFAVRCGQEQHENRVYDAAQDSQRVQITSLSAKHARECYARGELTPEEVKYLYQKGKLSKPQIIPVAVSIDDRDEKCRGNDDGQFQKGESVLATITFLNQSDIPAGEVELRLLNESGHREKGVSFVPAHIAMGSFQAGESKNVNFLVTVDENADINNVVVPFILQDTLFGELVNSFASFPMRGF